MSREVKSFDPRAIANKSIMLSRDNVEDDNMDLAAMQLIKLVYMGVRGRGSRPIQNRIMDKVTSLPSADRHKQLTRKTFTIYFEELR